MHQVLHCLNTGDIKLADVPTPCAARGQLLLHTSRTLVSTGTERMLVDFVKAGLIDKARQKPDTVRMVVDKCRTDFLAPTPDVARNKLDQALPMGYCRVDNGRCLAATMRALGLPSKMLISAWVREHSPETLVCCWRCLQLPSLGNLMQGS